MGQVDDINDINDNNHQHGGVLFLSYHRYFPTITFFVN